MVNETVFLTTEHLSTLSSIEESETHTCVIPEFQPAIILMLFMITTLLVALVYSRNLHVKCGLRAHKNNDKKKDPLQICNGYPRARHNMHTYVK